MNSTKRMKVDVPDFQGKMDLDTFEDQLTSLGDYFDWFLVTEDRKVRYVKMKLKVISGGVWKNKWEEMFSQKLVVV